MRNSILIEVSDVAVHDFDSAVPVPELIENMEGGVRIFFNDIEEVKTYQDSIKIEDEQSADQPNEVKQKINAELTKAIEDNKVILDSIKAYAKALFQFVFKREGHREDKLVIVNDMLEGILKSANSVELEQSVREATFELGVLVLNHNLTFYFYAHNDVDYNFEKIKNQLLKELEILKLNLAK